ncbi:HEPN domain-containing protein [Otariodibacter sp.]|uniref:HEPN domain-containing protein n=1 Tax=Otariodibacter sp. TaxID=3030919 RepID=UPI00260324A2|nr:HEPN domain-containing protein [Otariodibacter sp.]
MSNLKDVEIKYLEDRNQFNDNFRLRIHRSLSWLKMAEEAKDLDTQFIALWIAFNAAYARELDDIRDRAIFNEFLLRICSFDKDHTIYDIVWKKFSQSIRLLLDNKFVFQPFWDFHNGKISEKAYLVAEVKERERFLSSLEKQKTERILDVMFSRLYTLRNQIIHGGATYQSSVNREQLRDGCNILSLLIPAMLQIMMENHSEIDWGKPFYPVVN